MDLILELTVYLPVWHSHCIWARFSVLVSCSGEHAVHSCQLLGCRSRLRNLRAVCSTVVFYLVGVLQHVTAERRYLISAGNAARQW